MAVQFYEGIGRRKESTARGRLMRKSLGEYFTRLGDTNTVLAPLSAAGEDQAKFDLTVVVKGGGVTGQAEAVQLGLARALIKFDPDLRPALRRGGYLTRDARVKERKKPGLKRARKAPTYTKR